MSNRLQYWLPLQLLRQKFFFKHVWLETPFWNNWVSQYWTYHSDSITGVNFINVIRAAFTSSDPKFTKRHINHQFSFALSVPTSIKAARKMLMKSTTGNAQFFVNGKGNVTTLPKSWLNQVDITVI